MSSRINVINSSVLLASTLLLAACATPREQDPTWQKLTEVDGRVLRIERVINNQSLLELAQKDDSLQNEVRTLRGQLEEIQHSLDTIRTQQRDLYADLDNRVQALEQAKAATPVMPANVTPQLTDSDAYQAAFNLLKEGKYQDAEGAFSRFLASYPQSALLDNAQYWLGETHYVLKNFEQARNDFQTVLSAYPSSGKAPDATLKLGYTQYELKSYAEARRALQQVVDQYPDTNAAKLAQQRLAKMSAEGH